MTTTPTTDPRSFGAYSIWVSDGAPGGDPPALQARRSTQALADAHADELRHNNPALRVEVLHSHNVPGGHTHRLYRDPIAAAGDVSRLIDARAAEWQLVPDGSAGAPDDEDGDGMWWISRERARHASGRGVGRWIRVCDTPDPGADRVEVIGFKEQETVFTTDFNNAPIDLIAAAIAAAIAWADQKETP